MLFDKATEEELPVNTLSAVEVEKLFRASLQSWKRRVLPHHLPGETVQELLQDLSGGCLQAEGLRAALQPPLNTCQLKVCQEVMVLFKGSLQERRAGASMMPAS